MMCCKYGHVQSLRILLKAKANLTLCDNEGRSALCHTISRTRRHIACLRMLIQSGVDIDAADSNGTTTLHRAILAGEFASAAELIDLNANINLADKNGSTALHFACQYGSVRMVQLLLVEGASGDPHCHVVSLGQ